MVMAIILAILTIISLRVFTKVESSNQKKTTVEQVTEIFMNKYDLSGSGINVKVTTDSGTFAKGTFNEAGTGGGGLWFAAKTANGWELAFDGNGIVPCDAANKYSFPVDLIPKCIDTQNNNDLINR